MHLNLSSFLLFFFHLYFKLDLFVLFIFIHFYINLDLSVISSIHLCFNLDSFLKNRLICISIWIRLYIHVLFYLFICILIWIHLYSFVYSLLHNYIHFLIKTPVYVFKVTLNKKKLKYNWILFDSSTDNANNLIKNCAILTFFRFVSFLLQYSSL